MSLRRLSFGIATAVLAFACGSEDSNNPASTEPETPVDVPPVQRETCDDNPLLAGCPGNAPSAVDTGAPVDTNDPAALAKAAAENVLASNCGQCHGPNLTPQAAKAGMNYIDDIDRLVDTGKIKPLNSAGSLIVQRMIRGEMPPVDSGLPRVTDADITIVSDYIDNPTFWPTAETAARSCTEDGQVVDFDELYQDVASDLRRAEGRDRPFFRYISLTNRYTAGVCADALEKDRQALTKMLNMLSRRASISEPVAIDRDELIYRIDLRDFNWDEPVDVDGRNFNDAWEAIAENNPYAVRFEGSDAEDAQDDAETDFPVMFADQMLSVATIGNLYYGLIGVDSNGRLQDFIERDLGIDVQDDIENGDALRAGTTRSRISRQDRVVERHDITVRNGVLWQAFDFKADDASDSIFEDPFDFAPGGTEVIFTLPNGMLGFIIADQDDNIVEDSDILLDTNQNNFRVVTSVSCANCHATGFIPVVDEVGPFAISNARALRLNRDEVEQLQDIYQAPEDFARQVKDDSSSFYQRALTTAGLPLQGGDPVSNVFLRFDADVTLADAAGDLGVTPDDLADALNDLDPSLAVLERTTVDRDDFTEVYLDSLCELTFTLENQPEAAVCDSVLNDRRRR
ncbi:MAG TPA: cytochrome c [Polyangiaceae bacterium]|jgi:serine/threonine-protein kinase|nr:cytochrome c [Polyangiaceae bacterium]